MRIGQFPKPDPKDKQDNDVVKLLKDWLTFSSDVQVNDAAGDDWLGWLKQRTQEQLVILTANVVRYTDIFKKAHEEYLKDINSPEYIEKKLKDQADVASIMNKVIGAE